MTQLAEDLAGIREKIKNSRNWCTKNLALDREDQTVSAIHPSAVRWCMLGAALAVTGKPYDGRTKLIEQAIVDASIELDIGEHLNRSIVRLNDDHDHTTVMRLINRALKSARG